MNPNTPPTPREKLEMRLTALLMGELPPEEAAAIRALMAADPALAALHERLRRAFELLREASAIAEPPAPPAPAQLSSERREKLLAHFKTAAPASVSPPAPAPIARLPRRNWTWMIPTGIAAAVIAVLGAGLLLPTFTSVSVRGGSAKMSNESNYRYANQDWSSQTGMITTFASLPQGTPAPMNISSGGTLNLIPPPANATAITRSGAGTLVLQPAPSQGLTTAGGIYLPPAPSVIETTAGAATTSSLADTQQLQNESPGDVFNTVRVDASKQRLKNLNYFAGVDTYPTEPPAPSLNTASSAGANLPPAPPVITSSTAGAGAARQWRDGFPNNPNRQKKNLESVAGGSTHAEAYNSLVTNASTASAPTAGAGNTLEIDEFGNLREDQKKSFLGDLNGQGDITLNGVNTYTGATTITSGLLKGGSGAWLYAPAPTVGQVVSGAPVLSDSTIFINGGSSMALNDSNIFIGATAGSGTVTATIGGTVTAAGGLTFPSSGTNGNGTLSLGSSNASPVTAFAATPTLNLYGVIHGNNEGAAARRDAADTAQEDRRRYHLPLGDKEKSTTTGPGKPAANSPITISGNIATGADKGSKIDSRQLSKTTPLASLPSPTPAQVVTVTGKTQSLAQLEAVEKLAPLETSAIKRMSAQSEEIAELKKERVALKETPSQTPTPPTTPQPEVLTRDNAFSTFSLNVSDVSFKLAAASLEQGRMPDPASIRSEEFVNAFDYRDPEPAPGTPLAFASERARYPFAQNRDLLRFSVKTAAAGRQPGRPLNIVLLLDKSGSMERADRVNIVREALRVLAAQLQPQDKLSIVTFARTPRLWADGVAGNKAGEMIARVSDITPEGGTNLDAALDLGYATALRHYSVSGISRVVLFTDGAANLGDVDPAALTRKVETQRKKGVALDCFGIGWEGYNDDLLERLTRNGDGRYGFINTPEEAASNFAAQLAGALQVAASDVKTQVEFNPGRVKAYRQIGYAKHQLTKEQFRDNTVNAAQIGAAESGNALYVVEVDPRGEGDLATVRVRFRVPGTNDYREHEWAVPFNGNAPPLEQASPALRLAGTAAAFSEMLAASPYAAEVTTDRLLGLLNGVPSTYGADPHPRKLEWMIRQVKSLSGH